MVTLLLRLCGPMQSWGTRSRFSERDTELEPSKSGVIGLVAAALGRPRSEPLDDLAAVRLGVRVDREGIVMRDYHTAGAGTGIIRASGALSKDAQLSNRYYLAGADFLVGLESHDRPLLETIERALRQPVWQLSLGRKAFVPSIPVYLPGGGLRPLPLEDALDAEPWPLEPRVGPPPGSGAHRLRLVLETTFDDPSGERRVDQPLGAAFERRTFGPRTIRHGLSTEKEYGNVPEPLAT